jgi:uncharacterized protein (TIGR02001 family)
MVRTVSSLVAGVALSTTYGSGNALAENRWRGPFGGAFSASISAVTDYSFAGISQTNRQPAIQPSFLYRTGSFTGQFDLWVYAGLWGSNIDFPASGPGIEIDLMSGIKVRAFERRLSVDLGYVRYTYPGSPAGLGYDYGDFIATVGWDFGILQVNGRVRYSPDSFGSSGAAWNKRLQASVPLPFLRFNETFRFKAYGTLGNQWVENFMNYGIPSSDYWYWQTGLVISAYGLDFTIAYADTSIDISGCGNTANCEGRVIFGITKVF